MAENGEGPHLFLLKSVTNPVFFFGLFVCATLRSGSLSQARVAHARPDTAAHARP